MALQESMTSMQQRCDEISQEITNNKCEMHRWKTVQSESSAKSRQIAQRIANVRSKIKAHDVEIGEANKTLESVLGQ